MRVGANVITVLQHVSHEAEVECRTVLCGTR